MRKAIGVSMFIMGLIAVCTIEANDLFIQLSVWAICATTMYIGSKVFESGMSEMDKTEEV